MLSKRTNNGLNINGD